MYYIQAIIDKTQENSTLAQKSIRLGVESDSTGIVQGSEIWLYEQMVYAQTRICPREWDSKFSEDQI